MSYEPQPHSKVGILLAAMRATAAEKPVWTTEEVAKTMGVPRGSIAPYLVSALNHRLLYRRTTQAGIELSISPFGPVIAAAAYEPYVPPKTAAPRAGSDVRLPSRAPGNPPAPNGQAALPPAPTPAPTLAPTAPPPELPTCTAQTGEECKHPQCGSPVWCWGSQAASEAPAAAPEIVDEGEQEAVVPDAFVSCRTGAIVLVGIVPDEEGLITIPADLVAQIKRQIAWSPAQ